MAIYNFRLIKFICLLTYNITKIFKAISKYFLAISSTYV